MNFKLIPLLNIVFYLPFGILFFPITFVIYLIELNKYSIGNKRNIKTRMKFKTDEKYKIRVSGSDKFVYEISGISVVLGLVDFKGKTIDDYFGLANNEVLALREAMVVLGIKTSDVTSDLTLIREFINDQSKNSNYYILADRGCIRRVKTDRTYKDWLIYPAQEALSKLAFNTNP